MVAFQRPLSNRQYFSSLSYACRSGGGRNVVEWLGMRVSLLSPILWFSRLPFPNFFFASGGAICDLTDISLPFLPPLHSVPLPSPSPSPPSPRFFDNKYVVIVGADKKPPYVGGRGVSIGVSGGREDEQSSSQKERIGERASEDLGLKSRWNVIAAADSGFGEEGTHNECVLLLRRRLSLIHTPMESAPEDGRERDTPPPTVGATATACRSDI